ncbi:MAG: DUF342 domain-containing protein [Firmicutes bacterium]|nr:DUF342 domain-containing protein [Bacillota bacterium]
MAKESKTDFVVKPDGIYVIIDYDVVNVKNDILKLVRKYNIKDVDFQAIDEAILKKLPEQRISNQNFIDSKNERMEINISEDKMTASVIFTEPVYKGLMLSFQDALDMLKGSGVRFGIKEDKLRELIESKEYGKSYIVAEGERPTEGKDGYLEYFFSTDKKKIKPKELDNGYVDYRNVDFFEMANAGQTLAIMHDAIPGKDGMNVLGKINQAVKAKPAPRLPKGKNTVISEDGKTLKAEIAGRIIYLDYRVSISPILEIAGDVGNETGNINFLGTVVVKKNVVSGFSIVAGGDIEVEGTVEDGVTLISEGNIMVMKGIHGGGKTLVKAGLDINANFVENCTLEAGINITANSIMHSNVKCGNVLNLIGKRGLLVGGKIIAGEKVRARTIGSNMATVTDIEVGISPEILEEYRAKLKELERTNEEYEKTMKIVDILSKVGINELPEDKKKILMESMRSKIVFKTKIKELQTRLDELQPHLNKKSGKIEAGNIIYSGVKVMINNTVMYIRDNLDCCALYSDGNKVRIGTYY